MDDAKFFLRNLYFIFIIKKEMIIKSKKIFFSWKSFHVNENGMEKSTDLGYSSNELIEKIND